ncbi:hypothetical protein MtrunA17_Chr7g0241291 [Medicago truncatula]|nr:hypothetical protein MtrunA17_Chr7g0241291 [Medicago truncatula]
MRTRQSTTDNGFVNESSTFIISDDLFVRPNHLGTSLNLLQNLGINDFDDIDKQIVNISKKEACFLSFYIIDLLKFSLLSKSPLSDFIFKKEHFVGNLDPRNRLEFWIGEVEEPCNESDEMVVKVVRRKSNEQILFVEGDENFSDFILSFLTIPLGGVVLMFEGLSFLCCMDNLYNSMTELNPDRCLRSQYVKDRLCEPQVGMHLELRNQILPIGETNSSGYIIHCKDHKKEVIFVDPKSPISGGFLRGPTSFMVTDDLVVSPMSLISGLAYLERMKVPLNDVEERVIRIGVKEGLSILKASLTSTSSLTNGLSLSIMEQFLYQNYL